MSQKSKSNGLMLKVASFIVDKRNLFFLLFGLLMVFSAFSNKWVTVENSLTAFLSEDTETRRSLAIMEDEFVTFGTAKVMVANVTYDQALAYKADIEKLEDVSSVTFSNSKEHYANASALFDITFAYDQTDSRCLESLNRVRALLSEADTYVSSDLDVNYSEIVTQEMTVIAIIVVAVVILVLFATSQTYAEVPVLILTFGAAAVIQFGTNFVYGTISFVSNSVTVVLQLALSVDYAIILCNRYKEERQLLQAREACILSLSKGIPEIAASSLTTIGGLLAMTFMQFGMGPDMGKVLIKAILLSLLSVFLLMPGLLMVFAKAMDKSRHKSYVPNISFVGKFGYAARKVVPPIFALVLVAAFIFAHNCPYVYGYGTLTTPMQNESQIAEKMIKETFGEENPLAILVPAGDYEKEKEYLDALEACPEVTEAMGIANTVALGGYTLADKLTPREFAELTDLDYEEAELVYAAYAVNDADYAKVINGIANYSVPLIDMFLFACEEVEQGYVTLDGDMYDILVSAGEQIKNARLQLEGPAHSRLIAYLELPEGGDDTFAFLDKARAIGEGIYGEGAICLAGTSTSEYDLKNAFEQDNTVVSLVSIFFVLVVLLFTFRSVGMPVLLIMIIQGSIWINFAIPTVTHSDLFFISYLIVSSIQMGANIDYAIVISSRYTSLRETLDRRQAIVEAMNQSFPTIITSGSMMTAAGFLIGARTSEATVASIGQCLGRGTLLSIILVMFVLPSILVLGDGVIQKTAFNVTLPIRTHAARGLIRIDGRIRGKIEGTVSGTLHATVRGKVNALIDSGEIKTLSEDGENKEDKENA